MSVGLAISISFVICLLLGVPIATAMGIASLVAIVVADLPLTFLVQVLFEALNSFPLIAIPLFILAGAIMERGGLSSRIVAIFMPLIGKTYGGLAIVTILACMFFAAISGSGPPTVAAIGSIMIPSMLRQGYSAQFAGGVTASGGLLTVRIVATGVSGLSPEIMGLGPVEAVKKALGYAKMSVSDIDLFEINEAFAVQVLGSARDLGIDEDKLNVSGGAIALGHPFGMTGARITATLLNNLSTHDKTFGVETMCVGGGQGMAMVIERLS